MNRALETAGAWLGVVGLCSLVLLLVFARPITAAVVHQDVRCAFVECRIEK